jgi:hypothetical protein
MTEHYRLTLDVDINPAGETEEDIKFRLKQVIAYAMNNGTITGDSPSTVVHYQFTVEKIP